MRRKVLRSGVEVLDHHPALELLADRDGAVTGAAGMARQQGLRPWQAKKLYHGNFGNPRPDPAVPMLQVQEGLLDPAAGRTYAEISFEGRSQHKTQAQGGIEARCSWWEHRALAGWQPTSSC